MPQKKETKKIKVRDLKPKKDARGGVVANVNTNANVSGHTLQGRHIQGPHGNR
jgi:hypothetical protein